MKTRSTTFLLIALASLDARAEEPWRFITLADWHSAEKYIQTNNNPDWFTEAVEADIANAKMLNKTKFGGDHEMGDIEPESRVVLQLHAT